MALSIMRSPFTLFVVSRHRRLIGISNIAALIAWIGWGTARCGAGLQSSTTATPPRPSAHDGQLAASAFSVLSPSLDMSDCF